MLNSHRHRNITLDCYLNGHRTELPWLKAHEKLWTCGIGWVIRLAWIRHRVRGREEQVSLKRAHRQGSLLLYSMMTRHRCVLSLTDMADLEPERPVPNAAAFQTRARRTAEIFHKNITREQRPFDYVPIPAYAGVLPAYRMKDAVTWLIIVGAVSGTSQDIDWSSLQTPPTD